jgi:hypothetical protein
VEANRQDGFQAPDLFLDDLVRVLVERVERPHRMKKNYGMMLLNDSRILVKILAPLVLMGLISAGLVPAHHRRLAGVEANRQDGFQAPDLFLDDLVRVLVERPTRSATTRPWRRPTRLWTS